MRWPMRPRNDLPRPLTRRELLLQARWRRNRAWATSIVVFALLAIWARDAPPLVLPAFAAAWLFFREWRRGPALVVLLRAPERAGEPGARFLGRQLSSAIAGIGHVVEVHGSSDGREMVVPRRVEAADVVVFDSYVPSEAATAGIAWAVQRVGPGRVVLAWDGTASDENPATALAAELGLSYRYRANIRYDSGTDPKFLRESLLDAVLSALLSNTGEAGRAAS